MSFYQMIYNSNFNETISKSLSSNILNYRENSLYIKKTFHNFFTFCYFSSFTYFKIFRLFFKTNPFKSKKRVITVWIVVIWIAKHPFDSLCKSRFNLVLNILIYVICLVYTKFKKLIFCICYITSLIEIKQIMNGLLLKSNN